MLASAGRKGIVRYRKIQAPLSREITRRERLEKFGGRVIFLTQTPVISAFAATMIS
jgi:hypothetical protein